MKKTRVAIVGPVYPYRAGIAYCTTELAKELGKDFDLSILSFSRQYPARFYPGTSDIDASLESKRPREARFRLDVLNPLTWILEALRLRRFNPDAVVFVWWIWVWAIPYFVMISLLRRRTLVILQCHNVTDKEPSWWKSFLTTRVLRRGDVLVVHAATEAAEAERRLRPGRGGNRVMLTHLPVHAIGDGALSRDEAKKRLGLDGKHVALAFGHVRPYKGVDISLRAWKRLTSDAHLVVAGEVWWKDDETYRKLARDLGIEDRVTFDFRFIPDAEAGIYFSAADVVLAPYRVEAQSGVAMTALHFGRAVIASTVGGLPEIVEDGVNGYLVPPEDEAALAAAVDRFFTEADRARLEAAASESERKYSWEKYGSLFRELVTARVK